MEINAGKTLLAMASSLATEKTAMENPFMLAMKEGDGIKAVCVADSKNVCGLTATIVDTFAQCMKEANLPAEAVFDLFSTMILHAVKEYYGDKEISKGLGNLVNKKATNIFGKEEGEEE